MSDLHKMTLSEVIDKLADVDSESPACPMSADMAYQAIDRDEEYQIFTLSDIARLGEQEPWASSIANTWLVENGY